MRYAIYHTPAPDDALTRAAEAWIGRSAFGREPPPLALAELDPPALAYHTACARRYGFHATLKAPFRLASGASEEALTEAFTNFAAERQPFVGPRLVLGRIDGFFALVPEQRHEGIDALARDAVIAFEPFRAPLTDKEVERRHPESLSADQLRLLHQWGYPFVMDEFRFHMTLTGRVPEAEAARVRRALEWHFAPLLEEPHSFSSLALFVEPEPGMPFAVKAFHEIGHRPLRKTA